MKRLITILLFVFIGLKLGAQVSHLSGKVEIEMKTGQFTCDFILSNIPDMGKDYQVLLNKGFNIKAIKDSLDYTLRYEGFYDGKMRGEGLIYIPQKDNDVFANPRKLHFIYTGAFPIYTDTLNFIDFQGLIAFNGKTVRATDQSKWYPIIYDVKNDQLLTQLTYDIEVRSKDSKAIFVSGDLPQTGPIAKFSSTVEIAPLLFAGDFDVQKTHSALFLNTSMNAKQLAIFEQNIAEIKAYYLRVLKFPYPTKNTFIEHTPVEKFNKGRSWGFVSFPVIAFAGLKLGDMIDEKHTKLRDVNFYPFLAHEIGHYYFGNVLKPNSTLFWFFLESTTEYLSIKAAEKKLGRKFTTKYFEKKGKQLKDFKVIPLNKIKDMNSILEVYRYSYGPLLLRGLEQMIGEKRMFKFLHTCLTTRKELTDYNFFRRNALKSGISQKEWDSYEKDFILTKNVFDIIK
jgi:hypothetical protein